MMINIFVDHHIYIYVVIVTSSSGQVLSTNGGRVGAMYTGLINSSPAPEYLNKFIQRMKNRIKNTIFCLQSILPEAFPADGASWRVALGSESNDDVIVDSWFRGVRGLGPLHLLKQIWVLLPEEIHSKAST